MSVYSYTNVCTVVRIYGNFNNNVAKTAKLKVYTVHSFSFASKESDFEMLN